MRRWGIWCFLSGLTMGNLNGLLVPTVENFTIFFLKNANVRGLVRGGGGGGEGRGGGRGTVGID